MIRVICSCYGYASICGFKEHKYTFYMVILSTLEACNAGKQTGSHKCCNLVKMVEKTIIYIKSRLVIINIA